MREVQLSGGTGRVSSFLNESRHALTLQCRVVALVKIGNVGVKGDGDQLLEVSVRRRIRACGQVLGDCTRVGCEEEGHSGT